MFTTELVKLLEYNKGEFEGSVYSNVLVRINGQILKFKLDSKKVGDCSSFIDKDVQLTFDITKGQNNAATVRVIEVIET